MLRMKPSLKALGIICAALILCATVSHAQRRFTTDSADCEKGLTALASAVNISIKPASPARKIGFSCVARDVLLTIIKPNIAFYIKRMEWKPSSFESFAQGKIPKSLDLFFEEVKLLEASQYNPVLFFMALQGIALEKRFDVGFKFTYDPNLNALNLQQAKMDFHLGNVILLSARMHGVAPSLSSSPGISAVAIVIDQFSLRIKNRGKYYNPLFSLFQVKILPDRQARNRYTLLPLSDEAFRNQADAYVIKELATLFSSDDMIDLRTLIVDIPYPKGDAILDVIAPNGLPASQLLSLIGDGQLAEAFEGTEVSFRYAR